ncbi:MAG: GNAT family N-acetyltransferase [Pseudomonadota bacterium]
MSKLNFTIRPFAAADLAALHTIRNTAFAPVYASFRALVGPELAPIVFAKAEDEQGKWLDTICRPDSDHCMAVATLEDRPIGFCDYSTDAQTRIGEIGLNAVDPDYAGKGVGTALYEHALNELRAAGMQAATVSTGGDASHAPARRAYAKAGFAAAVPSVHLYRMLE